MSTWRSFTNSSGSFARRIPRPPPPAVAWHTPREGFRTLTEYSNLLQMQNWTSERAPIYSLAQTSMHPLKHFAGRHLPDDMHGSDHNMYLYHNRKTNLCSQPHRFLRCLLTNQTQSFQWTAQCENRKREAKPTRVHKVKSVTIPYLNQPCTAWNRWYASPFHRLPCSCLISHYADAVWLWMT